MTRTRAPPLRLHALPRLAALGADPVRAGRQGEEQAGEGTLAALLQSAVLKRFESCWWACLQTVRRMVSAHEAFLAAWDSGTAPPVDLLRDAAALTGATDLAAWLAEVSGDPEARVVTDFDPAYRTDVTDDLIVLQGIELRLAGLSASTDPKLAVLGDILARTAGKVCVFSTYGDTVTYLDTHLDVALGIARERVVVVGSETTPDERNRMLARFSPPTVVGEGYLPRTVKLTFCCQPMSSVRDRTCSRRAPSSPMTRRGTRSGLCSATVG